MDADGSARTGQLFHHGSSLGQRLPNLFDEETISIQVDEVNAAPVLGLIGNQGGDELSLITFTASATDADIPPNILTYSLGAGAPAGASINPTTGVFTWTPTEAQGPGNYSITVRVTDNGSPNLFDEETIIVDVDEVNVAPVLGAIGNKSGDELTLITFTASATDADLPANTLTFSLGPGRRLERASTRATGVFTWTPTEAQGPGNYSVTVRVTDNGSPSMFDEETISIQVTEVNVAPLLASIGAQTVDEGSLLTFTASAIGRRHSGEQPDFLARCWSAGRCHDQLPRRVCSRGRPTDGPDAINDDHNPGY